MRFCIKTLLLAAAVVTPLGTDNAHAQESYKGKQIRMVVGSGAGGGYDAYARALARFLPKYIPGAPSVITQNMPGASGMAATNWGYAVAPKDGTVIVSTYNALLLEPLFGNKAAEYDALKYEWVGSISKQQQICMTWHTSPVKTIEQARDREVIVSATGSTGNSFTLPKVVNTMLNTRFKVIGGYSTTEARLAVERGEAEGICGLSWSTLKASNPDWVNNKRMNVLLQTGTTVQAELPNVPLLYNLVSKPEDKQLLDLLFVPEDMGRPFVMPPGSPKEMVTTIRRAFDAVMKDPGFIAEAEKTLLEIDPVTGEEMQRLLQRAYATPKPIVEKAAELLGGAAR